MSERSERISGDQLHEIAVVVPVYRGEATLARLVEEIAALTGEQRTPGGNRMSVVDVVLVHDCGPDRSDEVMRKLAAEHPFVRNVWLSRNFGQHAATLAGIASTAAPWVVTLDEDGQHAPADIGLLLDTAVRTRAPLVYGLHEDGAPHAWWRNAASRMARRLGRTIAGSDIGEMSSFRLVLGGHARAVAAYCGPRIYLDSALQWAIGSSSSVVVSTRPEWRAGSGYRLRTLLSHFWTLVLSSGTRPLRFVSALGLLAAFGGFAGAVWIVVGKIRHSIEVPGWASLVVPMLLLCGAILFALGVVAEYIGALLRTAQGRPLYIIVDDAADGPLPPA